MNEQNEIKGDAMDDCDNYGLELDREEHRRELLEEAPEGERGFPETHPDPWANAPVSALAARLVAGDDAELFDEIKGYLKGE
jgi:hypothetical protein